jgi:acyl dehydratase
MNSKWLSTLTSRSCRFRSSAGRNSQLYSAGVLQEPQLLLTGQLLPHFQVLLGLGWDDLRLPNPVRPGDELDLEMTVLEMRESKSRSDRGIVRNRNLLRNQKRETVLECISNVVVARRSDANAPTRG